MIQHVAYNVSGVEPEQCDIEKAAIWRPLLNCTGTGYPASEQMTDDTLAEYDAPVRERSRDPLTLDDIKPEIDAGRPIILSVGPNTGMGHILVLYGYWECEGRHQLYLWNPGKGTGYASRGAYTTSTLEQNSRFSYRWAAFLDI